MTFMHFLHGPVKGACSNIHFRWRFFLSSPDDSLEPFVPAHEVILGLTVEPVAQPELNYEALEGSAGPSSIDAILSENRPSLTVTWENGVTLSLENDALDESIAELAGEQPGLTTSDSSTPTPWNAQRVLKGNSGNDQFIVESEPLKEENSFAVTYVATSGSDRYEGSPGQDLAYYGDLNNDSLSGLYLSNEPDQLPLVSNNLPPLIADAFESDDVLVHKNPEVPLLNLTRALKLFSRSDPNELISLATACTSLPPIQRRVSTACIASQVRISICPW